jgi:hypothetical protein
MEKKAFGGLGKDRQKESKDVEGTLVLLEDEKKTNDTKLQTYTAEFQRL